jgi:hypothetical protein
VFAASLRAGWDRLGLVLGASITWAIALSVPFTLERWLPPNAPGAFHLLVLGLIPVLAALPTAGVFSLAHRIAAHEEVSYGHLWQDGAALLKPALWLTLIQTAAIAILVTACLFYLRVPSWLGRTGVILAGYALLMWGMMAIYQWPALIAQERGVFDDPEHRARRGAPAAVRRSFFLALGSPFYTVVLLSAMAGLSLLMVVTVVLPALLWIGTIALTGTFASRALLVQFGVLPAPVVREPIPDEKFRLPDVRKINT